MTNEDEEDDYPLFTSQPTPTNKNIPSSPKLITTTTTNNNNNPSLTTTTTTTTNTPNSHLEHHTIFIQTLMAAPIPVLHQFQQPQTTITPPLDHQDQHSSSSHLSRPSKLSDENLQRQSKTALKERVKKSIKMRDTERWARETATTPISESNLIHSSPSPDTLPRPRISLQPVPTFKPITNSDHPPEPTIISEHATINDWHSENTNTHQHRSLLQLSPLEIQFINPTPTSADFQHQTSINNYTIQPGTLIAQIDLPLHTSLPSSPYSHPPPDHPPFSESPRIQEIPLTPPPPQQQQQPSSSSSSTKTTQQISDPLMRARIHLQEALSTTPQARSTSNSPSNSPIHHYHSSNQQAYHHHHPPHLPEPTSSDEELDNDSGLSPIKEDRTAELAAEHSWRIRQAFGSPHPTTSKNHHIPHPPLPPSSNIHLDHADPYTHPTLITNNHPNDDLSTASLDADQTQNSINQPTSHSPTHSTQDHTHTHTHPPSITTQDNKPHDSSQSINDEHNSTRSSDDILLATSHPPPSTPSQPQPTLSRPSPPLEPPLNPRPSTESITSRRQVSPLSVRTSPLTKSNPPLSLPASARRPLPVDLLNRLEMEEWRNQTGVDDRHSLSFRPSNSAVASRSFTTNGGPEIDRGSLVGVGGEERRGIKDRWGNSWGLESHVLSPLSERTERSLTTMGSVVSLSTIKSTHSLRSLDSTSNSLVQRLEQADTSSVRVMKLATGLVLPGGVIRAGTSTTTNQMARSVSCPLNRIDSPTKSSPLNRSEFLNSSSKDPPHLLLEEKMKRKEQRRIKREKREKRRAEEIKSSESLAQKQERRRQEKKRKEEFLEKKQQILLQLQEDGENSQLVRDLGILYLTSNVGVAGLKLAIRHLETSLQMNDTDALAWSSLGKAWSDLYGVPEAELAKLPDAKDTTKPQQAHNATIGLRKAIINSRTHADVLKYKVEWARYLEKLGRWRDSLGVIGEVIKNEGKLQPKCWAALGFIGLRLVFGQPPLEKLETDDLQQGFNEQDERAKQLIEGHSTSTATTVTEFEKLSDPDRIKLLSQVRNAFERALTLVDEQIVTCATTLHNLSTPSSSSSTKGKTPANLVVPVGDQQQEINRLRTYRKHYAFQLTKLDAIEKEMVAGQSGNETSDDHHQPLPGSSGQNVGESRRAVESENLDEGCQGRISDDNKLQSEPMTNLVPPTIKESDLVTEEIRECPSSSPHSSPAPSYTPVCQDPEPTNYVGLDENSRSSQPRDFSVDQQAEVVTTTPASQNDRSREIADYLDMATPTSQIERSRPLALENFDMRTPASYQLDSQRENPMLSMVPGSSFHLHRLSSCSDGPEVIIQYDDVDTTNDYSDSRNSDPFRPSSALGHHLLRNALDIIPASQPNSSGSRHDNARPSPSRSDPLNGSLLAAAPIDPSSGAVKVCSTDHAHEQLGEDQDGSLMDAGVKTLASSEPPLPPSHTGSLGLASSPPPSDEPSPASNAGDRKPGLAHSSHSTPHNPSRPPSCSPSSNSAAHAFSAHPHFPPPPEDIHNGPNIDLDRILESKLKELDKQKVIDFLELDSDYHSQVLRLRKKLNKIEEEREFKRKEMFMLLGLNKGGMESELGIGGEGGSGRRGEEPESESEEDECLGRRRKQEEEERMVDGERGIETDGETTRNRERSSVCSAPVFGAHPSHHARSQPHGHHHHQQQQHHQHLSGRSICDHPSPSSRPCSQNNHPLFPLPGNPPPRPVCPTTTTECALYPFDRSIDSFDHLNLLDRHHHTASSPPPALHHGQANIALQGIAAILKLATSTSTPPPLPPGPPAPPTAPSSTGQVGRATSHSNHTSSDLANPICHAHISFTSPLANSHPPPTTTSNNT